MSLIVNAPSPPRASVAIHNGQIVKRRRAAGDDDIVLTRQIADDVIAGRQAKDELIRAAASEIIIALSAFQDIAASAAANLVCAKTLTLAAAHSAHQKVNGFV